MFEKPGNALLSPGDFVRHPGRPDWGPGQVQSMIGHRITVNFENATADFDISRGSDALQLYQDGKPAETVDIGEEDGYIRELRHIVECIREGRAPSVVTADDGLSAVEICEAEEQSAELCQPVKL